MASADKNTMISNEFRSERKLTNRWVFREEYLNFITFTLKKKKDYFSSRYKFFHCCILLVRERIRYKDEGFKVYYDRKY